MQCDGLKAAEKKMAGSIKHYRPRGVGALVYDQRRDIAHRAIQAAPWSTPLTIYEAVILITR